MAEYPNDGNGLRLLRELEGKTQSDCAEGDGLSQPQISRFESGRGKLTARKAARLVAAIVAAGAKSEDVDSPLGQARLEAEAIRARLTESAESFRVGLISVEEVEAVAVRELGRMGEIVAALNVRLASARRGRS